MTVWLADPIAVGVYVTEQLVELPEPDRVQLAALKLPAPLLVKVTVPVGPLLVPTSVSVTVALQVVASFTATEAGVQLTLILVVRFEVTVTVVVPKLPKCVASPLYVAVIVCVPVPTAVGVYVAVQLAELPAPERVQLVGLNVPAPLLVKLTVPVGVVFVPTSVSVTVAVQLVGVPSGTLDGEQLTLVVVERFAFTVMVVEPLLPLWSPSPL